ncbi:hypothetical protein OUZ56_012349 [Daphnia magna]|uniref:BED-type domain-containing protein n=1 Tax=Daphnia magna TaxID=35525 RepID=A0ABQ9Z2R3_9CRUS|nr:hypothetical protein OUZ56_012349 [Daphnia magna]
MFNQPPLNVEESKENEAQDEAEQDMSSLVTMANSNFEEHAALVEDEEGVSTSDPSTKQSSLPPATIPMPSFTVSTWPKWRSHFFQDWRKSPMGNIFSACKLCHKLVSKGRKDSLDQGVTRLVCEENLPLHIVNRPGFCAFMQLAVPGYQLLTQHKFCRWCSIGEPTWM